MGVTPMMGAAMPRYRPMMPCKESQKWKLFTDTANFYITETGKQCVLWPVASFPHLPSKQGELLKGRILPHLSEIVVFLYTAGETENSSYSGRQSGNM